MRESVDFPACSPSEVIANPLGDESGRVRYQCDRAKIHRSETRQRQVTFEDMTMFGDIMKGRLLAKANLK